jgi:hypothetical protein
MMRGTLLWMLAVVLAGSAPAGGQDKGADPVRNRLSVRRVGDGFVLYGFRQGTRPPTGEAGERFRLKSGLTAEQVAAELATLTWGEVASQLTDEAAPAAYVERQRPLLGDVERVRVDLDKPGGQAWRVIYEVEPANRSRFGLEVFLKSAFGEGDALLDERERLQRLYQGGGASGETLLVDATRLPGDRPQWRLRYVMIDPALAPASAKPEPKPRQPIKLTRIWPPPEGEAESAPAETPTEPGRGQIQLHQIYPPPEERPSEKRDGADGGKENTPDN